MSYQETPFRLRLAALDPAFQGTPSEFATALVELLSIVSPDGFYGIVVADSAPSSNVGLWLQGGTKPYVWDVDTNQYVPMDLSASLTAVLAAIAALQAQDATHTAQIAALQAQDTTHTNAIAAINAKLTSGRVVFSYATPGADDRTNVLWVQTDSTGNTVTALKNWDASLNVWKTIISFPLAETFTDEYVYDGLRATSIPGGSGAAYDFDFNFALPTGKRWSDVDVMVSVAYVSGSTGGGITSSLKWNCGSRLDELVTTGASAGAGFTDDYDFDASSLGPASDRYVGKVPSDLASLSTLSMRVTAQRLDTVNNYTISVSIRARAVTAS